MRLLFLEATVDFRDKEVALEMEWASYCDMLLWYLVVGWKEFRKRNRIASYDQLVTTWGP